MLQTLIGFVSVLWHHHVLRPRLFATYRQGRMLEADLKNTHDIWDVCDKWVPDADYLYLMGALAEPVDKHKSRFRGVIPLSVSGLLIAIGSVMIFGYLANIFFSASVPYSNSLERQFDRYWPLLVAFFATTGILSLSFGRAKALPVVGVTALFYIAWQPIALMGKQFLGVDSALSWITSLCGLYVWITLNSDTFAQSFAIRQQLRILRIIMKTAMNEQAMRRSETLQRLAERKKRQDQMKRRSRE